MGDTTQSDQMRDAMDCGGSALRRVLVLTPTPPSARWLQRALVERGPAFGLRIHDIDSMLFAAARYLAREVPRTDLLRLASEALGAEEALQSMAGEASYRSLVLELFLGLERAGDRIDAVRIEEVRARDRALLAAFRRFEESLGASHPDRFWAGSAPRIVAERKDEVPFLARAERLLSVGFDDLLPWQRELFEALGVERLEREEVGEAAREPRLIECAGPEVEIAVAARLLRKEPKPTVVRVPADEVSRWARRLRHRDVPVRAHVAIPCGRTAVARTVRAMLGLVSENRWNAYDLETVLLGGSIRPFGASGEGHPIAVGAARDLWQRQRRGSGTAVEWKQRIGATVRTAALELEEKAEQNGWDAAKLEREKERVARVSGEIEAAVGRIAAVETADDLADLLGEWKLGAVAGETPEAAAERQAARVVVERLHELRGGAVEEAISEVYDAFETASVGEWIDEISSERGTPAEIVPHDLEIDLECERTVLAGMDRYPVPPAPGPLLDDELIEQLGLESQEMRYLRQMAGLGRIANRDETVVCWRSRDGQGASRSPGPWVLDLPGKSGERHGVGDLVPSGEALSALEAEVAIPERRPGLPERAAAIRAHETARVGPHTGELGVRVPPPRTYSVTGLQSFAILPYIYFVERVLGIAEAEQADDDLNPMEQGGALHGALETAVREALDAAEGPVDVLKQDAALRSRTVERLTAEIVDRHAETLAPDVVEGDRGRWETELGLWWDDFLERAGAEPQPNAMKMPAVQKKTEEKEKKQAQLQKAARKVEIAETLAPGNEVVAAEYQIGERDAPLAVDLGEGRTIAMTGRIDRIERDDRPGRRRLNIVDYKSGRPKSKNELESRLGDGSHLQLPLYARALEQQRAADPESLGGAGDTPVEALRLEFLKRRLDDKVAPFGIRLDREIGRVSATQEVLTVAQAAARFAAGFVDCIEQGHFPALERTDRQTRGPRRIDEVLRVLLDEATETKLPKPLEDSELATGEEPDEEVGS
jgi:RecB family exonuclease